jgi:hypothetical protein
VTDAAAQSDVNEPVARNALKDVRRRLEEAARELAIGGKIVKAHTKSVGTEGVLALEVSDVAHRVGDLEPSTPGPDLGDWKSTSDQGQKPIDALLSHLDAACTSLDEAADDVRPHVTAEGEEGVLVEEVIDVSHRAEGRRNARRLERDSQTGEFFDPPPPDSGKAEA